MSEPTAIICLQCGWSGYMDGLLCRDDDLEKPVSKQNYDQCPDCGETDCFEDEN